MSDRDLIGQAFFALADPTRRAIYEAIVRQPQVVAELAAALPVSQPAVSQHLKVLKSAGLVEEKRMGRQVRYQALAAPLGEAATYLAALGSTTVASAQAGPQPPDEIDQAIAGWADTGLKQDPATVAMITRLLILSGRLQRLYAETAAAHGVNVGEVTILGTLRRNRDSQGYTPGELTRMSVMSPPSMAKQLERLERTGLVRRIASKEDKRSHRVQLTAKGQKIADAVADEQLGKKFAPFFALPAAQQTAFDMTLRQLLVIFR